MTTYHRWLILPMVETADDAETTITVPKYVDAESRLDGYGYSAGPFEREHVESAGYSHLLAYNEADRWRVVLAWGGGDTAWNALNEIHANNHDTATLADHGQDVEPVLDAKFGDRDWDLADKVPPGSENSA